MSTTESDIPAFPAAQWAPTRREDRPTIGPDVARIALERYGYDLLPWQRWLVDLIGEQVPDEETGELTFAYTSVSLGVGRRSGKTLAVFMYLLARMELERDCRVFFTAQHLQAATTAFEYDLIPMVEDGYPAAKILRANGRQSIQTPDGSLLRLFSPVPKSLHGAAGDLVVLDECFGLELDRGIELEVAFRPLMATRPKGQVILMSAAGNADSSYWLQQLEVGRTAAERDSGLGLAHIEWTQEGTGLEVGAEDTWRACHPGNVPMKWMRAEYERAPDQFLRTVLNVSNRDAGIDHAINLRAWDRCRGEAPTARRDELVSFALDVEPDSASASIVACTGRAQHVELIDRREGVAWVPDRLAQLLERYEHLPVAIDIRAPAGVLEARLRHRGIPLRHIGLGDAANGAAGFADLVHAQQITHTAHPALDEAVKGSKRRLLGDGAWCFSRTRSEAPVSPLIAASFAWYCHLDAHGDATPAVY